MYSWYHHAEVCYAFLADVSQEIQSPIGGAEFHASRWHRRGWTLQELLAPRVVLFLNNSWEVIGSKHTLVDVLAKATGIERDILIHQKPLEEVSVATKMSWAVHRETTRVEDEAYCLMGIFGVYILPAYGEKGFAFVRLQEELLRRNPDQSLFVWGTFLRNVTLRPTAPSDSTTVSSLATIHSRSAQHCLLASSPKDFRFSRDVSLMSPGEIDEFSKRLRLTAPSDFTPTAHGIRATFPLYRCVVDASGIFAVPCLALLPCKNLDGDILALLLHPQSHHSSSAFFIGTQVSTTSGPKEISISSHSSARIVALPLNSVRDMLVEHRLLYIPYPRLLQDSVQERDLSIRHMLNAFPRSFNVRLTDWSEALLHLQNYSIYHSLNTHSNSPLSYSKCIRISRPTQRRDLEDESEDEFIEICIRRCPCSRGRFLRVDVQSSTFPSTPPEDAHSARHSTGHPAHIVSWVFRSGTAMKTFQLNNVQDITITLTILGDIRPTAPDITLQLGIELTPSHIVPLSHCESLELVL